MDLLYNKPSPLDFLAHEGVQGMKWGQRNGPPYPLSRKQASAAEKKAGFKQSKFAQTGSTKKVDNRRKENANKKQSEKIIRTKHTKSLSNEQLSKAIDRMRQEQTYKNLYNDLYVNKGKEYLKSEMGKGATSVVRYAISKTGQKLVDKGLEKIFSNDKKNKSSDDQSFKDGIFNAKKSSFVKDASDLFNKKTSTALAIRNTIADSITPTSNDIKAAVNEEIAKYRSSLVDTRLQNPIIYLPGPTKDSK